MTPIKEQSEEQMAINIINEADLRAMFEIMLSILKKAQ